VQKRSLAPFGAPRELATVAKLTPRYLPVWKLPEVFGNSGSCEILRTASGTPEGGAAAADGGARVGRAGGATPPGEFPGISGGEINPVMGSTS
jgi:hypothetical protein